MMKSGKLAQATAVILVMASAISASGCAVPGSVPARANNHTDMIDYCVKRGTHMECRKESASAYSYEREMYNERLEMREENFE